MKRFVDSYINDYVPLTKSAVTLTLKRKKNQIDAFMGKDSFFE